MATSSTYQRGFKQFPSLPAELRHQIWHDCLPLDPGPALYFWRKECRRDRLAVIDPGFDDDPFPGALTLVVDFDIRKLGCPQFDIPPAFVNHEAHDIACCWKQNRGIEWSSDDSAFIRPFCPEQDALYIPLEAWDEFYRHYDRRYIDFDALGALYARFEDPVRILAISESLLHKHTNSIPHIIVYLHYEEAQVLLIVMNEQADSLIEDSKEPQRWEYESLEGGTFFWNNDRRCFELQNRIRNIYEARYRLIEQALTVFSSTDISNPTPATLGIWNTNRGFEIRPVMAIRR